MVLTFIALCFYTLFIYQFYFKPIRKYSDIINRGFALRIIGRADKEKEVYLKSLRDVRLSDTEQRDVKYVLGLWYARKEDYSNAIQYFDGAFQNFPDDYNYKKEFVTVVDSYIKANCEDEARLRLQSFLSRVSFDKNFKKLERPFKNLL
ncbi:hypothetical protein GJU40_08120 [Bacillus lacus]|uniref:Tetratricopeptide repeat protein n=1 Tax=Metabacillus lacus TaxID=1983721 RepID=A0A7X2LY95_9BACI|nr:hypothetical protein [Metabacillus lacus]MRX72126.1 hypothetical protein [Metabacillus lacus]